MQLTEGHRQYWRKTLTITAILLVIWFVVTYVVGFFARDLLIFHYVCWFTLSSLHENCPQNTTLCAIMSVQFGRKNAYDRLPDFNHAFLIRIWIL